MPGRPQGSARLIESEAGARAGEEGGAGGLVPHGGGRPVNGELQHGLVGNEGNFGRGERGWARFYGWACGLDKKGVLCLVLMRVETCYENYGLKN